MTVLSPDVEKSKPNLTYLHLDKVYSTIYNGSEELNFMEFNQAGALELFQLYTDVSRKACSGSLESRGYMELMTYPDNFKFDLVLHDFTMDYCILTVLSKFGEKNIVGLSAYNAPGQFGANLIYPSFMPAHDLLFTSRMNFVQRVTSTLTHLIEYAFRSYVIDPAVQEVLDKYYKNTPKVSNYKKNYKMYLINSNPITDNKQPVFPNQKNVGGAQIRQPKELPAEFKDFADSATNGLVLFSLGTNVRSDSLGTEKIETILKALGRLKEYKFLWKFETKEKLPIQLPENVKIQAWMPQNDILAHRNTKLFISHCGLLSTQEAMWYGVPILGFPVFADQPQNALKLVELGVSKTLSILSFIENELYETIKQLIEDPKYKNNANKISKAIKDSPMTALEEATYWTEWVLRNPDIDLEGGAAELNLFQRHSLDIYTAFLLLALAVLYVVIKLEVFLFKLLFRSRKSKVQLKNDKKRN